MGGNGSLGGHVAAAASTVTATAAAAWSATTAASAAAFAAASAPTRRHACALRPPGRRLGADVRVKLFDRVVLSPGLGIRIAQQTLKGAGVTDRDMDQLMSLPFYGLAVDVKVLKWLNLRFGASQAVQFHRHSVTPPNASTTQDEAGSVTTRLGTGLGFRIPVKTSELSIDLHVDPLFWVNGPAIISGDSAVDRWGLSGALRYAW